MKLSKQEREARAAQLKAEIAEIEARAQEYRDCNRIEFFEPFPHQTRALELINAGKKTILLQGGNQIGKTVFGACFVGAACLGIQPWDRKPTIFGNKPIKVRVLCEDWEHHAREVIIPKLKYWLPAGRYETLKNNVGIEGFWTFENGSTIEIMTNMQDTKLHESWTGHIVWADEPTSYDKYVANKRGLLANHGIFLMTMTAVRESWVLDEIVLNTDTSFGCVTEVPMRANPTLSEDAIREFEATCKEDEKVARIAGGWLNLVGLVWKGFNTDRHIIDSFKIPTDWPVVAMIDFHTQKPHAIGYYAVNPQGIWHVIDESWKHQSAEEVADEIIRHKEGDDRWRIEHVFIDPLSKGDTQYLRQRGVAIEDSFSIMQRRLALHNITLDVASKDKSSGILNVEKWLKGPNGIPTLYFLRGIVNKIPKEGHVWEIQRWNYKDGEPVKENDHFMENLYRLTLTGIKYTEPKRDMPVAAQENYNPLNYGLEGAA